MGRTYSNTPVISKIKIGDAISYFKDADVRALLNSIDDNIWVGLLNGASDPVVLKSYVDALAEAALEIVTLDSLPVASESVWTEHHNHIVLIPKAGPQTQNLKDEYVIVRNGTVGAYTYAWEKIGDTAIDLSDYLTNVDYVAASHSLRQTKNGNTTIIHSFGDFADVDTGSVNLSNYLTGVSAKVTAAGTVSKPNIDVTPTTGTIEVIDSVGTLPSKAADKFTAPSYTEGTFVANVPTSLDLTKFNGGSKAADTFSAGSFVEGKFTPASVATKPTSNFAVEGMIASVGTGDDAETLIISVASVSPALTDVTINGGSKAADSFTAPSFSEGAFVPASLAEGFYSVGTAASKASDTFSAGSFVEGAFNAGSLPTKKDQSVLASIAAELHEAPAFTGSEVSAVVTETKGGNEVVNPVVE